MAACSAASAADVYGRDGGFKDEPAGYIPVTSWAGVYAGIHAGASFDDGAELVFGGNEFESIEFDTAFVGGIHVGYNWQNGSNWVLGLEAAVSVLNDEFLGEDTTDFLASIRGRVGYSFDRTLIYATGGVAFLGYTDEAVDGMLLDDDLAVGFVVGAGLDHKITDKVSIGVEGLYHNFSSDREFDDAEVDRDFWTAQARLNYHFGGRGEALK